MKLTIEMAFEGSDMKADVQGEWTEVVARIGVLAHQAATHEAREIAVRAAGIEFGSGGEVIQRERAIGFFQHFE